MEFKMVKIKNPNNFNLILGQAHFIKTVEDIHELMVNCVPNIKFGLAFCEASGPCLIRYSGNDDGLTELAKKNAQLISAGHSFLIFMQDAFPINVLPRLKQVPEVVRIFCATANPVDVIIVENDQGRGIIGVIDGGSSKGFETKEGVKDRKELLRKIGYKL